MADNNWGMGLSPKGSQLVGGMRRSMEPEFDEFLKRVPDILSGAGWDSRAIRDIMGTMSQKWSSALARPAFEVGKQELGQEWQTGERVGSTADALKRLRESLTGSMARLKESGEIQKKLADISWDRHSALAESMKPGKWDWLKDLAVGTAGSMAGTYGAGKMLKWM